MNEQVFITETVVEPEKEEKTLLERPPVPTLTMGKDKKTDKVVITVTRMEKDWIRYLAQQAGYENVTDFMMSFIYAELEKVLEEEIMNKHRRGKRKSNKTTKTSEMKKTAGEV